MTAGAIKKANIYISYKDNKVNTFYKNYVIISKNQLPEADFPSLAAKCALQWAVK